uniref:Putative tail protein n=1 Tax=viral metagenome TaxID=1070528 RepID=A0A6H1Z8R6_9ZZZZ
MAGFGCASLDTQKIDIKDDVSIDKVSVTETEPRLIGHVYLTHYDAQGNVKDQREYHNLVVSAGKAGVASRINGAGSEAAFTYIAIGIGTTAAAAGNTTLESEIVTAGGERAAGTPTRITTNVTNDTAQLQVTYSFTGSFAVTESGVLNAASTGTLIARRTFSAINVVSGDSIQTTWKFVCQ